jgi:hypothetical protein
MLHTIAILATFQPACQFTSRGPMSRSAVTPEEFVAFGKRRHGARAWQSKLAAELDLTRESVWRMATGRLPISTRTKLAMDALATIDQAKRTAAKLMRMAS